MPRPTPDGVIARGGAAARPGSGRGREMLLWALVAADASLIFLLSSRPRPSEDLPPSDILQLLFDTPGVDKVAHFLSFFFLGALASLALNASRRPRGIERLET